MRDNITNIATASGTHNSVKIDLISEKVTIPFSEELTIDKTADKTIWIDGILNFVVEIKNPTSLIYSNVVFDDTIETTKASFIENSLTLNGIPIPYTYNNSTGILVANIGDITPKQNFVLRFQVEKFRNTWNRLNNEATITWEDTFSGFLRSNFRAVLNRTTFSGFLKSRVCVVLNGANYPIYNGNCCKKIGYICCC